MSKIVFVCLGNICRSPMAEFVMKDLNHGQFSQIESRATSSWEHGNPIHKGTRRILDAHHIPYDKAKTSQQITIADLEHFDQVIAMDKENLRDLVFLSQGRYDEKIKLLLDDKSVPDPWYTGDFEETYRLVRSGCERLLAKEKTREQKK